MHDLDIEFLLACLTLAVCFGIGLSIGWAVGI